MMRNEDEAVVKDDRRLLDLPEHLLRKTAIVNVIHISRSVCIPTVHSMGRRSVEVDERRSMILTPSEFVDPTYIELLWAS